MNRDPRAAWAAGAGAAPSAPAGPRRWPALVLLFCFVALMWVIEAADQAIIWATGGPQALDGYGVRPWTSDGLLGIVFQPLLHGDWAHLIGNSVALLVLGSIIALSGIRPLISVTLLSWLVSGVVSWLLGGTGTVHIGASGIVFGYVAYVIVRGFFTRRFLHLVIGLLIGFFYGLDALAGLSPMLQGVSWQGHLGGAIGGVFSAYGLKRGRGANTPAAGRLYGTTGPSR